MSKYPDEPDEIKNRRKTFVITFNGQEKKGTYSLEPQFFSKNLKEELEELNYKYDKQLLALYKKKRRDALSILVKKLRPEDRLKELLIERGLLDGKAKISDTVTVRVIGTSSDTTFKPEEHPTKKSEESEESDEKSKQAEQVLDAMWENYDEEVVTRKSMRLLRRQSLGLRSDERRISFGIKDKEMDNMYNDTLVETFLTPYSNNSGNVGLEISSGSASTGKSEEPAKESDETGVSGGSSHPKKFSPTIRRGSGDVDLYEYMQKLESGGSEESEEPVNSTKSSGERKSDEPGEPVNNPKTDKSTDKPVKKEKKPKTKLVDLFTKKTEKLRF